MRSFFDKHLRIKTSDKKKPRFDPSEVNFKLSENDCKIAYIC